MCLKCHQHISDETVVSQLTDSLTNPKFEKWNETSISHLCLAYMGLNGETASNIASQLLKNYIDWKSNNPDELDGTFFGNPTVTQVKKMIHGSDRVKEYFKNNNINSSDEIRHAFYADKRHTESIRTLFENE